MTLVGIVQFVQLLNCRLLDESWANFSRTLSTKSAADLSNAGCHKITNRYVQVCAKSINKKIGSKSAVIYHKQTNISSTCINRLYLKQSSELCKKIRFYSCYRNLYILLLGYRRNFLLYTIIREPAR